jgi:hypothetical protein
MKIPRSASCAPGSISALAVQLPEVILAVDAQVHFSWIMLGREPRSAEELLLATPASSPTAPASRPPIARA